MPVYLWDNKILYRTMHNGIAISPDCCCEEEAPCECFHCNEAPEGYEIWGIPPEVIEPYMNEYTTNPAVCNEPTGNWLGNLDFFNNPPLTTGGVQFSLSCETENDKAVWTLGQFVMEGFYLEGVEYGGYNAEIRFEECDPSGLPPAGVYSDWNVTATYGPPQHPDFPFAVEIKDNPLP
jgi:hypothetical protein